MEASPAPSRSGRGRETSLPARSPSGAWEQNKLEATSPLPHLFPSAAQETSGVQRRCGAVVLGVRQVLVLDHEQVL